MKKILYFIMFVLGIGGILALWFTPFYHFDANRSLTNNTEYIYLVDIAVNDEATLFIDETDVLTYEKANEQGYLASSSTDQATFKENYQRQMKSIFALMNNQEETYFEYYQFEVLNQVKAGLITEYQILISDTTDPDTLNILNDNLTSLQSREDLVFTSTSDEVKNLEDVLKPSVGILKLINNLTLSLEERINNIKSTMMQDRRDAIINYLSNGSGEETAKAVALEVTTAGVVDTLFLGLQGETYGSETYINKVVNYKEKGIGFTLVLTTIENAVDIYKAYFETTESASKSKIEKIKEAFLVEYNVFPILLISITLLIFIICNIKLVFSGLKGMNGKKYPHTFINSLLGLACCCCLIFIDQIVDNSFWLTYSYSPEMLKLKQMFLVGTFDGAIVYNAIIFFVAAVISVFGRFCKWNKKKDRKYSDD